MTSLLTKIRDLASALVRGPRPIRAHKPVQAVPSAQQDDPQQQKSKLSETDKEQRDLEEARVADLLKQDQPFE